MWLKCGKSLVKRASQNRNLRLTVSALFVVMAHLRTLYRTAFLLSRKVIWYGMNGNGQGLEQVVHKHRTSCSGSCWLRGLGTISIVTFPHYVGSSPRSYPFTSATVRIPVYNATRTGRNLSDMWRSIFNISEHSRPQSLLGAWARGPGGSGDTGLKS